MNKHELEDLPIKFWKEYINSDYLERSKKLKIPTDMLCELIDSKIDITLKKHLIGTMLQGYMDDLIETLNYLNNEETKREYINANRRIKKTTR